MPNQTTLYKIQRDAAAGLAISVETSPAATNSHPHILFCGGFYSNMRGTKAQFLAQLAQQKGWGYTRFDYLGHGESDGVAEDCNLLDWLADTLAVIDHTSTPLTLIGSSMGAWLGVHAAMQRPEYIKSVVTIAAAPDFTETLLWPALTHDQQFSIEMGECVEVPTHYEGESWRIRSGLFESGRELLLLKDAEPLDFNVDIKMLHGTNDTDAPWQMSQQLMERLTRSPNATLTLIRGADHRLSDQQSLLCLENALEELLS